MENQHKERIRRLEKIVEGFDRLRKATEKLREEIERLGCVVGN